MGIQFYHVDLIAVVGHSQVVGVAECSTWRCKSGNELLTSNADDEALDRQVFAKEIGSVHSVN
jgi:hypothetical protein